ncbi:hypothetical protein HYV71_03990 [Candidatus Uhrbacteria bacterium]|nr:hypothetical protein [Candidatus Uhrbacteria bacterium]
MSRAILMLKRVMKSIVALNDSFGIFILYGYLQGIRSGVEAAKTYYRFEVQYIHQSSSEQEHDEGFDRFCNAVDLYLEANRLAGVPVTSYSTCAFAAHYFRLEPLSKKEGPHAVEGH